MLTIACLLEVGMVNITSLPFEAESALEFGFGVRAQTEMKTWCVKGMHMLKVVSSRNNLDVAGFN